MSLSKATWFVAGLATAGLFSGAITLAIAQAPSQEVISKLDTNQGNPLLNNTYHDAVSGYWRCFTDQRLGAFSP